MKTSELQATHRKCLKCGHITTDLNREKCKCGRYMHLVGQIYSPKVASVKSK